MVFLVVLEKKMLCFGSPATDLAGTGLQTQVVT